MRAGRPEVAIQFRRPADLGALRSVRILRGGMRTHMRTPSPVILLSGLALLVASCETGQQSPTAPSTLPSLTDVGPVAEYWMTLADETPPPEGEPAPEPAPPPPAAPAPTPPASMPAPGNGSWSPGPPPQAQPGVPVPTPPSAHMRVRITIDPEPVPYSGQPITDVASCRDLKHTWFYDQTVHAETGIGITIQIRENFFDGRFVNRNSDKIWIKGNGTAVLKVRWCSGYKVFHYTQTRFKFTDDEGGQFEVNGPWVRLQP